MAYTRNHRPKKVDCDINALSTVTYISKQVIVTTYDKVTYRLWC